MLGWALIFALAAIVAGFLGFFVLAAAAALEHDAFCWNRQNAESCSQTKEASLFFPF